MIARWLRRTAKHTQAPHPLVRRRETLLHDRVRSVREQLLELAWLLDRCTRPDPRPVAELHKLLRDGCESPLYNSDVHDSELRATLYYAREALATSEHTDRGRALPINHQESLGGPR